MKMLNTLRAATLATLAGAAFSIPVMAQANDYYGYKDPDQECRNKESDAQVIGGLLGAVVGGVIGSQVAGSGQRTEGTALGAAIGAAAGVGLGDESVDCDKRRSERRRAYYGYDGYNRPVNYRRNYGYNSGYSTAGYGYRDYRYDRYDRDYRHYDHERRNSREYRRIREQLFDVRYRLRNLRAENRQLEADLRWNYNRRLQRRLDWVCDEIRRLEKKERRLKKRLRRL